MKNSKLQAAESKNHPLSNANRKDDKESLGKQTEASRHKENNRSGKNTPETKKSSH
ncbi:MAG: hypothetical protein K0S27_1489 [Gammaproteobacteria bacterium]|jgi:hypothetical protein|nr:hypothetical protein [Gammaproteobacteria bacterium]